MTNNITIQINKIAIHINLESLGELCGLDPMASVNRYCSQMRNAVAREFPGATIEIAISDYSLTPYKVYVGDHEAPEAVQRRLRGLSGKVFASNKWRVSV